MGTDRTARGTLASPVRTPCCARRPVLVWPARPAPEATDTWRTDRGRTVTAANRQSAEALAADYDLGCITGPAPVQAGARALRRARIRHRRLRALGFWNRRLDEWTVRPTRCYRDLALEWRLIESGGGDEDLALFALVPQGYPDRLTDEECALYVFLRGPE